MPVDPDMTNIVAVIPIRDKPVSKVAGSVHIDCHKCRQTCWISPSGLEFIANHPMVVLCNDCVLKRALEAGGVADVQWAIGDGVPMEDDDKEAN